MTSLEGPHSPEFCRAVYHNLGGVRHALELASKAMPNPEVVWEVINQVEGWAERTGQTLPRKNELIRMTATMVDDMRAFQGDFKEVIEVAEAITSTAAESPYDQDEDKDTP